MFHQKVLQKTWCMSGCCHDEAANYQLPTAVAFWIIRTVSVEERSSLMQNLIQICCSTGSVVLNSKATQHTCSLNGIYHPHRLVQWSHHCSHMCIPVHPPWLPGYINVKQTALIILTMADLFLDILHTYPLLHGGVRVLTWHPASSDLVFLEQQMEAAWLPLL